MVRGLEARCVAQAVIRQLVLAARDYQASDLTSGTDVLIE